MKKFIIGVIVLIAIVIIGSIFFLSKVDDLILQAIEQEGSKALGVPVTVATVKTDLKQGSAMINGLTIANPAGYQKPFAFQINEFSAKVDYKQKNIAEIIIDKPIISAEIKGTKNNFQDLLDNLPESTDDTTTEQKESGEDIDLSIQVIKIREATVDVMSDVLGQQQFVMDNLVMRNLKGSPEAIAEQVTARLTKHITSQLKVFLKQRVKDKVNEQLNDKVSEKISEQLGGKLKGLKFNLK